MAGAQWPWVDGRIIATIVVFGVLVPAYALQQYFALFTTPETRSFPVHLLKPRTQVLLYVATSAITPLFVVVYFIPLYFQFVHDDSAMRAAVRLLPFVIITVVLNLAINGLLPLLPIYYMAIFLISGVFIPVGGAALMAFLDRDTPQANIYAFMVTMALATGLTQQIAWSIDSLTANHKDQGHVISFLNVSQIGGTVIALEVAGQVFQSLAAKNLRAALAGQGFSNAEITSAVSGARSKLFAQLGEDLRERAIDDITQAMQKAFVLPVVAGAALIIASLLMKRGRLF